jgi:hypothetical protein
MVTMKSTVFWNMGPCNQAGGQQCLRGILVNYWTTWCDIPENGLLLLSFNFLHCFVDLEAFLSLFKYFVYGSCSNTEVCKSCWSAQTMKHCQIKCLIKIVCYFYTLLQLHNLNSL